MISALLLLLTGPKVDLDVVYSKVAAEELKMDVYSPATSKGKAPCLVVIHGGAWIAGNRQDMKELCEAAASKGFVAATVQYRLAPKHKWPAMLDDVQTAVRYLRKNADKYNIDPNRIAASGASAGGHLSLLLGYRDTRDPKPAEYPGVSSQVKAVLDIFGPTDLAKDYPPTFDFLFASVLGKPKKDSAEDIKQASPVTFLSSKSSPTFIIHGTNDQVVPIKQSKRLVDLLTAANVPVEAVYIEGMGHEDGGKDEGRRKQFRDAIEKGLNFVLSKLK